MEPSIKISEHTQNRLSQLVEQSVFDPVYLISNTNELNAMAILSLFKEHYSDLHFNNEIDISIKDDKEPVEVLPNIFLCLSYRYKNFKSENITTISLLEELVNKHARGNITLVSQYAGDLQKAAQLGIADIQKSEEFYNSTVIVSKSF